MLRLTCCDRRGDRRPTHRLDFGEGALVERLQSSDLSPEGSGCAPPALG